MQYGVVNDAIEATVRLNVMADKNESVLINFVIDTGATGDMTLPPAVIDALNLPPGRGC